MRASKLPLLVTLITALTVFTTSCGVIRGRAGNPDVPTLTLSILSPATGTTIKGNVVSLALDVTGLEIKKADADTSGKSGHFHVFIDREPVAAGVTIPKEAGIVHSADNPVKIPGLSVGQHTFKVVVGNGAHARIGDVVAETSVTVAGPSIDASAAPTAKAGEAITVAVKASGVTLIAAPDDKGPAGTTGHLHLFIDRDPTAAGQAIPKEDGIIHTAETTVTVPGLTAGEHTIWVVLGDATHTPFNPQVADKVTITVA